MTQKDFATLQSDIYEALQSLKKDDNAQFIETIEFMGVTLDRADMSSLSTLQTLITGNFTDLNKIRSMLRIYQFSVNFYDVLYSYYEDLPMYVNYPGALIRSLAIWRLKKQKPHAHIIATTK